MQRIVTLVAILSLVYFGQSASAALYLNGVVNSGVDSAGTHLFGPAEYDSFDTENTDIYLNSLNPHVPIALTSGNNSISVALADSNFNALGLYFTTTNVLLPNTSGNKGLMPDLMVFKNGATFVTPTAGTAVATFGQYSDLKPYTGATYFDIDGQRVSVTLWNGSTLNLSVSAVPEPSSLVLALTAITGGLMRYRKRSIKA